MRIVLAAGLAVFTSYASAQSRPAFEVATVKPAPPPTDGRLMVRMGGDPGRLDYNNVSFRELLKAAYKVKDAQIMGPDWMSSERYNIVAKLPDGATRDQVPAMLQTLLVERFKLKLHKDQKVMPTYALLVAKSGSKLEKAEGEGRLRMMMGPKGRQMSGTTNMDNLANTLSNFMDRPVTDLTELKGYYNVDLQWSGDERPMGMMRGPGPGPGGTGGPGGAASDGGEGGPHDEFADAPSIFTALQDKLGLRLEPRKDPVDVIIIDNAEKVPTEN
jgi:uncharacterized protein (TIGR03435 family)